jgi:hypothetical protein
MVSSSVSRRFFLVILAIAAVILLPKIMIALALSNFKALIILAVLLLAAIEFYCHEK